MYCLKRGNPNRPYTKIEIGKLSKRALYDTGADISCISERVFREIPIELRPKKLNSPPYFKTAGKEVLSPKGKYEFQVVVEGQKKTNAFYVINNLSEDVILGMDFIRTHQLTFCPIRNDFSWGSDKTWSTGGMRTTQVEKMEPLSSKVIKVNLLTNIGKIPDVHNPCIATVAVKDYPLFSGGPAIIKPSKEGQSFIEIFNCSPIEKEIPRGSFIGYIEPILDNRITLMDPFTVNQIAEKYLQNCTRTKISAEKEKFIRDNVILQVPDIEKPEYLKLIIENHEAFSMGKHDLGRATTLKHDIELKSSEPIYVKQFKIPEAHQKEVERHVGEWLKLGVIQPSRSKYNSPLFIVSKKDGGVRIVQDFRALNANSVVDKYSMRDVSECIGEIGRSGSNIFSTLDLTSGFWQMVLQPKSRPYTAFTVPGMGQFQWITSPMGLLGCPASFQRLVEAVVKGIKNVIVYIDDLLIHSKTHKEHRQQLMEVLYRLQSHGLKANLKKCVFGSTNVAYLGFQLTPDGIKPGKDKLKVVQQAQPPSNVHEIRQFLGLCNFFRSHVRNFAQIAAPLTTLTKKHQAWRGGILPPDALQAFRELQSCLVSEPIVDYPRTNRQYALIVDAALGDEKNVGGLGAILTQVDEQGQYYVISYASRKLSAHEKNYTPFLLEMQACVWGIDHFSNYLKGRHFLLYTDHKPLEKLGKVHTRTLNRLQEIMNSYSFEIIYKKGSEMPADYISRHAIDSISWDSEHLKQEQQKDTLIKSIRDYLLNRQLPTSSVLQTILKFLVHDCFIENDIIWRRIKRKNENPRVVLMIPKSLAPQIIKEAHGQAFSGHNGILKTKERILQCYYWYGMDRDIAEHLAACTSCQMRKTHQAPQPLLLTPLPQPTEPNQRIHADLFGPLKTSEKGKKYILVITDAFTKYVELCALPDKEALTVCTAIYNQWICRYGIPIEIITDQGKEFANKITSDLFKLLEIRHQTTTAYHPQCNAQAEVANKTIAKYLSGMVDASTLDWEQYLGPLMFSYNTSFHKTINNSPFFLTYGIEPRLPHFPTPDIRRTFYGESDVDEMHQRLLFARDLARRNNEKQSEEYKKFHDQKAKPIEYRPSQWVLLDEHSFLHKNQKLAPKFSGPHQVIKNKGHNVVELKLANGKKLITNAARLKPYVFPIPEVEPEVPREAGTTKIRENQKLDFQNIPEEPEEDANEPMEELDDWGQPIADRYRPVRVVDLQPSTPETNSVDSPEDMPPPDQVINSRPRGRPRKVMNHNPENNSQPVIERRVTRSMTRMNNEISPQVQLLEAQILKLKQRKKLLLQSTWNKLARKNFKQTGDIFSYEQNYIKQDNFDNSHQSDSDSESSQSSDSEDEFHTPHVYSDGPHQSPPSESGPETDSPGPTPTTTHPSGGRSHSAPSTPIPRPRGPQTSTGSTPKHPGQYSQAPGPSTPRTAKRNLFRDFGEFLASEDPFGLGGQRKTSQAPSGQSQPPARTTRASGSAPPIWPIPTSPAKKRGKPK